MHLFFFASKFRIFSYINNFSKLLHLWEKVFECPSRPPAEDYGSLFVLHCAQVETQLCCLDSSGFRWHQPAGRCERRNGGSGSKNAGSWLAEHHCCHRVETQLQLTNIVSYHKVSLHSQKDWVLWNSVGPAGTGHLVLPSLTESTTVNRVSVAARYVSEVSEKNRRQLNSMQ